MENEYEEIVTKALEEPDEAFRAGLEGRDSVALALVAILDADLPGERAAERLKALTSIEGPGLMTSTLALAICENAGHVSSELEESALTYIREQAAHLPLNQDQGKRIAIIVQSPESSETRRTRLLFWLWQARAGDARGVAAELLSDPNEAVSSVIKQAMIVLGTFVDAEARTLMRRYAERQLEPPSAPPPAPQPQPQAAFYALNVLTPLAQNDVDLVCHVLGLAASRDLPIEESLGKLFSLLDLGQIRVMIQQLWERGHVAWVAQVLLPALLAARGSDLAPTVAEGWWPEECLLAFAQFDWETVDDRLYETVLKGLHQTENEAARAAIRQGVRAHCAGLSPDGPSKMPRLGARALLQLALQRKIDTSDPELLTTLKALGSEALTQEIGRVAWKSSERSKRLAEIISQADDSLVPAVIRRALELGSETAVAFLDGVPPPTLSAHAQELVQMAGDDEAYLSRLCTLSEAAADITLERWGKGHELIAFRALADSARSVDRLHHVSDAVRSYSDVTPTARGELLQALGPTDDRMATILGILSDRGNPPGSRPADEDLINAMGFLGDHLSQEVDLEPTLTLLSAICRETPNPQVRRVAYEVLGQAAPSPHLVDLLLERSNEEVQALRPTVRGALSQLADTLDRHAGDMGAMDRADAVAQLARIDGKRARVHARDLIGAEDAKDRQVAATILGATGTDKEAALLEEALEHEPNPTVREEMRRAIRRLRIGDRAAAHERLGELAGMTESSWANLDPTTVYGDWGNPLVTGLDRIAKAETNEDWGTAIDQLDEVAKALLFRAIDLAGIAISFKPDDVAKARTNTLDYGAVLSRQQLMQSWPWAHNLAALHQLRTEHISPRGKVITQPERKHEDWKTAQSYFKLGSRHCLQLILEHSAA